jgi:dihydrofolate synthase/folylpolyglutamate synthase
MDRAVAAMDPLAYLNNLSGRPIRLGLASLRRLLITMKHPEKKYASIVIGGTNGKGSIATMAATMLTAGGFRTGLYTSPHLLDIRERIRIDGSMIATEDLRACADAIRRQLREELTYFEFLTAMAFHFFDEQRVDIAVLEVGMGGRLDATNVVEPAVSVISNISLDHRRYLGTRIEQIAREKSGIIKKNGCCLTAAVQRQAIGMIKEACQKKKARFFRVGDEIKVRRQAGGVFSFRGLNKRYDHLYCPLRGRHQIDNAALAVGAVVHLAEHGFAVKEEAIRQGLRETKWEGRLEILQECPMVLVDGAHNPAGISSLCAALKEGFCYRRLTVIFGVLDDKDHRTMLRNLSPLADNLILTRPESERALSPSMILPVARQYHRGVIMTERPEEALRMALAAAGPYDLICVTGSLYLIGAVKRFFVDDVECNAHQNETIRDL